jgi:hypothetical protein
MGHGNAKLNAIFLDLYISHKVSRKSCLRSGMTCHIICNAVKFLYPNGRLDPRRIIDLVFVIVLNANQWTIVAGSMTTSLVKVYSFWSALPLYLLVVGIYGIFKIYLQKNDIFCFLLCSFYQKLI